MAWIRYQYCACNCNARYKWHRKEHKEDKGCKSIVQRKTWQLSSQPAIKCTLNELTFSSSCWHMELSSYRYSPQPQLLQISLLVLSPFLLLLTVLLVVLFQVVAPPVTVKMVIVTLSALALARYHSQTEAGEDLGRWRKLLLLWKPLILKEATRLTISRYCCSLELRIVFVFVVAYVAVVDGVVFVEIMIQMTTILMRLMMIGVDVNDWNYLSWHDLRW